MDTNRRNAGPVIAAPRLTAVLGLVLAVGVLLQGLLAGAFIAGHPAWRSWHELLGTLLVLPPLVSLIVALAVRRRQPEPTSALVTRAFLLVLVVVLIASGHAGRSLLALHIPVAIAVAGIAVRQATGFVRVPNLPRRGGRRPGLTAQPR